MAPKIIRKVKIAYHLLQNEGMLAVGIRSLEFLQRRKNSTNTDEVKKQLGKIRTIARYEEILNADFSKKKIWKNSSKEKMSFAWLMPPPGKGSGGHLNIFRFIEYLENKGHTCNIYMYVDGTHGTVEAVKTIMGDSYPNITALEKMSWLEPNQQLNEDAVFATSWETAYASYNLKSSVKRFYFVQDFEPYFYAVGGMSTLAENTYKMGFYGVTAGGWLKKKLASEYGMQTDSFDFGADKSLYSYANTDKRKEIFYYARPYTERRGFEVGILALDIFHKAHPEYVINIAGWDISEYYIPFPYKNLKTLEVSELHELYNRCSAALVLSYTNMSLLPLELLACGTIPVVNDGPNNRLVSDNPYIAYSQNDPHSLAEKLSAIVSNKAEQSYAKRASESIDDSSWDISGKKFVSIVEREMKRL